MSECSRKDLGPLSVCSPDSPLVSPPVGDTDMDTYNLNPKVSWFYPHFIKCCAVVLCVKCLVFRKAKLIEISAPEFCVYVCGVGALFLECLLYVCYYMYHFCGR